MDWARVERAGAASNCHIAWRKFGSRAPAYSNRKKDVEEHGLGPNRTGGGLNSLRLLRIQSYLTFVAHRIGLGLLSRAAVKDTTKKDWTTKRLDGWTGPGSNELELRIIHCTPDFERLRIVPRAILGGIVGVLPMCMYDRIIMDSEKLSDWGNGSH
ncbi:hypothetical protein DFH07DRAFT_777202 [Mycena maculata]|uniref:Uncharacterized protein n=1 Tax=Mycena maculata TaxID=230809 RepID=A0AAD7IJ38_9AGAR|nr:hypothetical protein DFH07DRAFT_777202 [Mycena maculata]